MIRFLCFFSVIILCLFLFLNLNKVEYFYYEDVPNNIRKGLYEEELKNNENITWDDLVLVHILHVGFDNLVHKGELIVNKSIALDIIDIFEKLYASNYKIEKVKLIDTYDGDDHLSMINNNTSAFNYRFIEGTNTLSNHSYGLAIDINPLYNPYVYKDSRGALVVSPSISRKYADRSLDFAYKIDENDTCYKVFIEHGFSWGGNWRDKKDYQHFEKNI